MWFKLQLLVKERQGLLQLQSAKSADVQMCAIVLSRYEGYLQSDESDPDSDSDVSMAGERDVLTDTKDSSSCSPSDSEPFDSE